MQNENIQKSFKTRKVELYKENIILRMNLETKLPQDKAVHP